MAKIKPVNAETVKKYVATNESEDTKEENKEQTVSEQKQTVFIYCGPTNNLITQYSVYKNGHPLHLKEHLKNCPSLKKMFVEVDEFAYFDLHIKEAGTVENVLFNEVKNYFSKAVS